MKRVALAIAALVGFSSLGLCDKEADRQKALQVYKGYFQLTLDATRAKTEIKAALFRDQAAQKHGFKNWQDFSDRLSLVLAKEDWTWVTDEAGKWYKAEQAKPATPAPAETPPKEQPPTAKVPFKEDPGWAEGVIDRTEELEDRAFFHLLRKVSFLSEEDLARDADLILDSIVAMGKSSALRGRTVILQGTLIGLRPREFPDNPSGIRNAYEGQMLDIHSKVSSFFVLELPVKFDIMDVVEVRGVYYKIWKYQNRQNATIECPLVVGKTFRKIPKKDTVREQAMKVFNAYYAKLVEASRKGVAADFAAMMDETAKQAGFANWNDFVGKMVKALGPEEWKNVNTASQAWYTEEMERLAAEEAKKASETAGPGPEGPRFRAALPSAFRAGAKFGWLHSGAFSLEIKEVSGEWIRADRKVREKKVTNPEAVAQGIPPVEEEVETFTANVWIHAPSQKWLWKVLEAAPADPASPPERQPRPSLPPSIAAGVRLELLDDPAAAPAGGARLLVKAVWGNWVQADVVRRRGRTGPEVWVCLTAVGPYWKAIEDKEPRSKEEMRESVSTALMAFYRGNLDAIRKRKAVNLLDLQNACAQEEGFMDWAELFRVAKEVLGAGEVKKLEDEAVKWYDDEMKKGRGPRRGPGGND